MVEYDKRTGRHNFRANDDERTGVMVNPGKLAELDTFKPGWSAGPSYLEVTGMEHFGIGGRHRQGVSLAKV